MKEGTVSARWANISYELIKLLGQKALNICENCNNFPHSDEVSLVGIRRWIRNFSMRNIGFEEAIKERKAGFGPLRLWFRGFA